MIIPIRRYVFRYSICLLILWFLVLLKFLSIDDSDKNSDNKNILKEDNIKIRNPLHIAKKLINSNLFYSKTLSKLNEKKNDFDGLGAMGQPVEIDKTMLSKDQLELYEYGLEKHAFNEYVSNLISIHRPLPDVRHSDCQNFDYNSLDLTASIIICFHNEAWSVLLRTIHSILNRSPSHLLKEIILVDDYSDIEQLKKPLDNYIKKFRIVSVIRQEKRQGLTRSRLTGAAAAQGDVIIFLDSHIETTKGWLEPLLDPISKNSTIVVTPLIDTIDDITLQYNSPHSNSISVGGFDWNLLFNWHVLPEREQSKRKHNLEPANTPTMAGGLFAISKSYFYELGTYDDGMDIWGGENLEISFRIWMCGGTLVTHPCSHVGHIFRKRSPYQSIPGVNVVKKNSIRLAEVWLDEYKKFYYERINFDLGDYGDVESRKLLRKQLKCNSFKWYLTEIYPELVIPENVIAAGDIKNLDSSYCIDANTEKKNYQKPAIGYPCHNQGGNQFFMLTSEGEIRRDDACLDYSGGLGDMDKDDKVIVYSCHGQKGNQNWIYNKFKQLVHSISNLCLTLSTEGTHIQMQKCNALNMRHKWTWRRRPLNKTSNDVIERFLT